MFKLKRREATMTSYKVRPEFHGEQVKIAADIFFQMLIDRGELCTILRRDSAALDFFEDKGGLWEPKYVGVIGPIPIPGKFENSKAMFYLGIDLAKVGFENADLSGLAFEPLTGGMSTLIGKISHLQSEEMKQLQDFLATPQKLDLSIGKLKEKTEKEKAEAAQGVLPMGEATPGSVDEAIAQDSADQAAADAAQPAAKIRPKRVRDRSKEKKRDRRSRKS
jgi:hypothetical protein